METSLLTILPNLSIGVISVLSLVFVTRMFVIHLDQRTERHEKAMFERENAMRGVEKEIRETLREHISQSNIALTENTRALAENAEVNRKVADILNRKL